MSLSPEQLRAASEVIQGQLGSSGEFRWERVAEAARVGMEHVELLPGVTGADKREAVMSVLREQVSVRLHTLLKSWRGPLAFGWWAYPALAVFVYPVMHRVLMWAFDELSPRFIDLLVSASKGELKLGHADGCSCRGEDPPSGSPA